MIMRKNHPYVFISYVRDNVRKVQRLKADLESRGVTVWIDREQIKPGVLWKDAIRQAISDGAFFIACFSEEYSARERTYMREELSVAVEELRQRSGDRPWFISALLSNCAVPDLSIGNNRTLHDLQHVKLYRNRKAGIEHICQVLQDRLQILPPPVSVQRREGASVRKLKKTILSMGFRWSSIKSFVFSGLARVVRGNKFTGQFILFVIKSYPSKVIYRDGDNYVVKLSPNQIRECNRAVMPVILICHNKYNDKVYFSLVREKYGQVSSTAFLVRKQSRFGQHVGKELFKIARNWYGAPRTYPAVTCVNEPKARVTNVKADARMFYDQWRREGCLSPRFGDVLITLRAWRHITTRSRKQQDVVHRLQLLGAAKNILETFTVARMVRVEQVPGLDGRRISRTFYCQTGTVRHSHRSDAIVSVITERFGNGPVRLYGVYEHHRVEGGTVIPAAN